MPLRERAGHDRFGNVYYVVRKRMDEPSTASVAKGVSWHDLRKREERHVDWAAGGSRCGDYSPDMLPPDWSQWLNFRRVEPPQSELSANEEREQLDARVEPRMLRAERLAATPAANPRAGAQPAPPAPTTASPDGSRPAENSAVEALRDGGFKPDHWAPGATAAAPSGRRRGRARAASSVTHGDGAAGGERATHGE
ncbi:hypothetical protein KFE25_007643 [Diacronema lutheri]|uniref:NADH dehydrogenase [ubiquinone] 1 alpha subcomplex subunit 12 n=1 Tax=Diacronema lutheri TaxID=2081491 RepID=A0A8J5XWA4_DIALT|nr:hypothetical protein KFE25_007643 [Diacronema lutheri]